MEGAADARVPLTEGAVMQLQGWAARYRRAVEHSEPGPLLEVGQAMFDWLDGDRWVSRWRRGSGPRVLEVAVDSDQAEVARAVLELPWELLADGQGFLAADQTQPLVVFRSLGRSTTDKPAQPAHRDLAVMFMAASPEGQGVLQFEVEESAILEATESLAVQVVVEESGCGELLKDRIAVDGAFEVVHVSCHGATLDGVPKLALETPEGELDLVTAGEFAGVLGEHKPPLVFVSACQTAESGSEFAEPFVRALLRSGVANVLGWDGSVYDTDATRFARMFYGELARHASVPFAASAARRDLLLAHLADPRVGRHWHLARVYAGSGGGGACCGRGKPGRPMRRDSGYKEFLDKAGRRVPVASAREFVGRRRQAQMVLRAFRDDKARVLIFGMGNLGKSSLAARIANRMPGHRTVVVFEHYDAPAIFEQLLEAVPAGERAIRRRTWREQIAADAAALGDAVEELLEGPFFESPILLVIDDLEQILEQPSQGQLRTPVADAPGTVDAWRSALGAVLRAFNATQSRSRLLLTSRYDFTLPDGRGRDLSDGVQRVALTPMDRDDRAKQWRAATLAVTRTGPEHDEDAERRLVARALTAAGGNPGLQEILCRPILSGELDAARDALDAVERFKRSGEVPEDANAVQEFFRRVSFQIYRDALTGQELVQLRAATLFSEDLPVPVAALHAAGRALGVGDPSASLRRLIGLGLVDDWAMMVTARSAHAAVNTLARPLAGAALTEPEVQGLAGAAIEAIAHAWQHDDGEFPSDLRGVEAARLALAADAPAQLLDKTAYAAGTFLFRRQDDARSALELLRAALGKIEDQGRSARPQLLRLASDCAERIGENELRVRLLEQALSMTSADPIELALAAVQHASATVERDGHERALATLSEAADVLQKAGEHRSRAVTMGKIADILQQRGETDEALRIRQEEQLPVYERLGDVRERAVTMGKIADILQQRGETDEALRIRQEEQLPVYERLGDVRSRAVTMGQIADILQQRGETDEALRIRREDELPVYERLGDVRSRAVTMGQIADILQQRGETDEALRIRREDELPVYERLGDVRSRAVTMGKIADILQQRGETDEALRIRREDELPVYERLGDVRSRAVTMGQIADILQQRGETDEALRIRREDELPVYERLGDVRSRAVTMGKIADILQQRGETDEALRIRQEEQLPVYERLGDVRSRAVTMGKIADILQQRGETDEALRIRREDELPVYERLGDVRSRAVTMGQIADILQQRGETDEALRIRQEEQLPVYERLGDVRSRAVTMGKIADILQQRGETDEALRIRQEEQLPVYERLGDVRSRAVTMGKIADILQERGETDEALRIRREDELPVYERLGDVRERAVTMGQIADILQQRGETDEALRIRQEEQLPVYERLGDVRSRAVTMGQIADILQQRGETDEALRIHLEDRLPVAQRMQDLDSIAHIRLCCAQIRISRGGLQQGEGQVIHDELAESFMLFQRLQRVDGIAIAGALLGQVLASAGARGDATSVLDVSAAAFDRIGHNEQAAQIRALALSLSDKS